ncbi:MAG: putative manganese transporter [Bacilli bacterium]|nr:putative manganese transporter [Bacilli bacterium]
MVDIILDTLIDSIKLLPFLFIVFFVLEYIEHKVSRKNKKIIENSGKYGPFIGAILGMFPQCGFSVAATNLFSARVITFGTLIAVYLSTSDEMLPILLSNGLPITFILKIMLIKVIIGMTAGFIIDYLLKNKISLKSIYDICEEEHCDCKHSLIKSTIKHTLNIFSFIIITSFILNTLIFLIGEDNLSKLLLKGNIFAPLLASLIGLIPNCASSILLSELYLSSTISFGSMMAGLLTGSGVALLVLFKTNKNVKENIFILGSIYFIGSIVGLIINLW